MDPDEILVALEPAWNLANRTDGEGKFLRPDYREALVHAWEDISVAYFVKRKAMVNPPMNLNVAMTKRSSTH